MNIREYSVTIEPHCYSWRWEISVENNRSVSAKGFVQRNHFEDANIDLMLGDIRRKMWSQIMKAVEDELHQQLIGR